MAWSDSRPGILVVHGGAGLDDHAKLRAKSMADLGFVAFACDMYGRGVRGNRDRILATLQEFRGAPAKLCQRARAGLDVLEHPVLSSMAAPPRCATASAD